MSSREMEYGTRRDTSVPIPVPVVSHNHADLAAS